MYLLGVGSNFFRQKYKIRVFKIIIIILFYLIYYKKLQIPKNHTYTKIIVVRKPK
jgi:hypothetical protein